MFKSTNAALKMSAHELAIQAGLGIVDASLFMFHIFGLARSDGTATAGCFETDLLESHQVFLKDELSGDFTVRDHITESLLHEHRAHEEFDSIAQRIVLHGGISKLVDCTYQVKWARVSHHYSHIAIETHDGVSVVGSRNLFAVGDAAGVGHGNGHQIRYPGVALTNCLVTARHASDAICNMSDYPQSQVQMQIVSHPKPHFVSKIDLEILKEINTRNIFEITFHNSNNTTLWQQELFDARTKAETANAPLWDLSMLTAQAVEYAKVEHDLSA